MPSVSESARNLPADPELALVEFVDRVYTIYTNIPDHFSDDDGIFIIGFIQKFVEKYEIKVRIANSVSGSPGEKALHLLRSLLQQRPNLIAKKIDAEIDDLISGYASTQENVFGVAYLNADEKKR